MTNSVASLCIGLRTGFERQEGLWRALIQYRDPANYDLVCEALTKGNRRDLIGFGPKCLIKPRKIKR